MKLKKILAGAAVGGALAIGGLGLSAGVANADPWQPWPPPGPAHDHGGDWRPGNDWRPGDGDWRRSDWARGDWNRGDWDQGAWWANNRHDWWDDRSGPPPWGWGPPPAAQWDDSVPPWVNDHPINYWGYNATPVWDTGFNQWGIWLFGIWIPLIGFGPA